MASPTIENSNRIRDWLRAFDSLRRVFESVTLASGAAWGPADCYPPESGSLLALGVPMSGSTQDNLLLQELSTREEELSARIPRHGSIESRAQWFVATDIPDQWTQIARDYVALAGPPSHNLEALKRAVFLAWYATAEPPGLTGLLRIEAVPVQRVLEAELASARGGDEELRAMIRVYAGILSYVFIGDSLPGSAELVRQAAEESTYVADVAFLRRCELRGRGAMGQYWLSSHLQ